jgi:hypothetical protein
VVLLVFLLFLSSFFLFQTRRFALGGPCEVNEVEVKRDKLISSFKSCLKLKGSFSRASPCRLLKSMYVKIK